MAVVVAIDRSKGCIADLIGGQRDVRLPMSLGGKPTSFTISVKRCLGTGYVDCQNGSSNHVHGRIPPRTSPEGLLPTTFWKEVESTKNNAQGNS